MVDPSAPQFARVLLDTCRSVMDEHTARTLATYVKAERKPPVAVVASPTASRSAHKPAHRSPRRAHRRTDGQVVRTASRVAWHEQCAHSPRGVNASQLSTIDETEASSVALESHSADWDTASVNSVYCDAYARKESSTYVLKELNPIRATAPADVPKTMTVDRPIQTEDGQPLTTDDEDSTLVDDADTVIEADECRHTAELVAQTSDTRAALRVTRALSVCESTS